VQVRPPVEISGKFWCRFDPNNLSDRAETMQSSLDEAISLLSKWRATRKALVLIVSDGSPDDPQSFRFKIAGVVKEIEGSWVGLASGPTYGCLKLSRPGTRFEYVEFRDAGLLIDDFD